MITKAWIPIGLFAVASSACDTREQPAAAPAPDRELVTQVSSYEALARGLYDGSRTLEPIRTAGDFGLGTLDGWDGEVTLLDGKYHLVDGDGVGHEVTDYACTSKASPIR